MPIPNLIYLSGPHGSGKTTLEKELEKENARLKRLVADLSVDNAILKEIAEGNF